MEQLWPIIAHLLIFVGAGLLAIIILTPMVVIVGGLLLGTFLAVCNVKELLSEAHGITKK